MSEYQKDLEMARSIAREVNLIGGRAFYVGEFVCYNKAFFFA